MAYYFQFIRPKLTRHNEDKNLTIIAWTIMTASTLQAQAQAQATEAAAKTTWIAILKKLRFSSDAVLALYEDQLLMNNAPLRELDNDKIKYICHAVNKPGENSDGHQIAELVVTHLQLAVFCLKHLNHCG